MCSIKTAILCTPVCFIKTVILLLQSVLHEDSHCVFTCVFHVQGYLYTHQNSHKLNVYHSESTRVAQKVMPHIFFSFQNKDSNMKIERQQHWCLLHMRVSTRSSDSAAVVVCENGVCVWHTLQTMNCNWILSGGQRKCGEHSQTVVCCVWKLCSR